jgi:hypothetical protein
VRVDSLALPVAAGMSLTSDPVETGVLGDPIPIVLNAQIELELCTNNSGASTAVGPWSVSCRLFVSPFHQILEMCDVCCHPDVRLSCRVSLALFLCVAAGCPMWTTLLILWVVMISTMQVRRGAAVG